MKGMPHYRQYPMGDVVNANLEPGEYVVRRNAVNALGTENMEMLNHADGAHGALNKLMVSASLVHLQPQDNSSVKIEANGFPIADSPVRQRVDATRNMQEGGEAKTIRGASPVEYNYDDPEMLRAILSVPASEVGGGEGLRYYLGEKKHGQLPSLDRKVVGARAMRKMAYSPADSIPQAMVEGYFDKPSKASSFLKRLGINKQEGGVIKKDSECVGGECAIPSAVNQEGYYSMPWKGKNVMIDTMSRMEEDGMAQYLAEGEGGDYFMMNESDIPADSLKAWSGNGYQEGGPIPYSEGSDWGEMNKKWARQKFLSDLDPSTMGLMENIRSKDRIDPATAELFARLKGESVEPSLNGISPQEIKSAGGYQEGGEVRETLLSKLSGGKYQTSQDLPSIREQAIPALEFMTGAEHVPEGEEASLLNLALAVPFLGKFGKGAKPALSKYYASLFGHGSASKEKTKNYIRKMFKELPSMEYDKASNRIKRSAITKLRDESPSVREMGKALYAEKSGKPWRMKLHEDKDTMEKGVKGFIKEAEDAHKYYYGKQHGGMVHGYQEGGEAGKYEKALQKAEMMGEAGYALPESLSAPAEEMSNMRSPEDLYGTYMRGGPEMAKHRMSGMESRALDSLLLQKMNNMGKSAVPHYQGGGQVSSGNMPAPTQEHVQTTLNSLPRSWPSGQPAEMIPSDVYNDLPTEKNLEVLMPYLESFGRIKTPLHQRNMRTLHRHGLNPDSFTPQMRGLIGRAVIQQLGAEGS